MREQAHHHITALVCYLMSVVVGLFCMASPFLAALALPNAADAAGEKSAADTDKEGSDYDGSGDADESPDDAQPVKMTLRAYPIKASDGSEEWDRSQDDTDEITTNGGQLRILVTVKWDDRSKLSEDEQEWSERGGFSQGFTYTSADPDTLYVGPTGVVTALKNGTTEIMVVPKNEAEAYQKLSASITITTANQGKGLIATKVQIVDKNNKVVKNTVSLKDLSQTVKLYARVIYKDKATGKKVVFSNSPGAPESERTYVPEEEKQIKPVEDPIVDVSDDNTDNHSSQDKEKEDAGNDSGSSDKTENDESTKPSDEQTDKPEKEDTQDESDKAEDKPKPDADGDQKESHENEDDQDAPSASAAGLIPAAHAVLKTIGSLASSMFALPKAQAAQVKAATDKEGYPTTVDEAFEALSWKAGDSRYINVTTRNGVASVKGIATAVTSVYACITGGDTTKNAGFGPGVVYGVAAVNISNGKTVEQKLPAKNLVVKVVYEKDKEQKPVAKKTYTLKQFEKLGAITRTYTLTRRGGQYVTDRAYGVPLINVVRDLKVAVDDIRGFRMAANDGANPGLLSAKFLLKLTRYYLPNYDLGGSWQESEQVPTMLALKDTWNENTQVTGTMNEGTRFRLVFGSASSADNSTDKSIKYISTMTIILKGAPPTTHGNGTDDGEGKDPDKAKKKKAPEGGNGGAAAQAGQGGGSGSNPGAGSAGAGGGAKKASGDGSAEQAATTAAAAGDDSADSADSSDSPQWRIFEMMNKSLSDLARQYEDNPFLPYLMPMIGLIIILSATGRYLRFKRMLA